MKSLAISTGPHTHLDHIGVLCAELNIPLVVTDPHTYALARTFYPQLRASLKEESELSLDYLATYDLLLGCGKFWAMDLLPLFELFFQKKMRLLFCPHGNSDKGHTLVTPIQQDISLVYGDHMIDLLRHTGALEHIRATIVTGNYRYRFYKEHKTFYDSCVEEHFGAVLDQTKQTILYAPTWEDKENPTSFFDACKELIEQLTPEFNLLIKLHPLLLEERRSAHTHALIETYRSAPSTVFITHFPPIYPLLARADIYIGDFSSIGYDFLAFNRPMFFLYHNRPQTLNFGNKILSSGSSVESEANLRKVSEIEQGCQSSKDIDQNSKGEADCGICFSKYPLYRCGVEIPREKRKELCTLIKEESRRDLSKERQEVYHYAFGKEKSPEDFWGEIIKTARN